MNYADLKVTELQKLCKERGLPTARVKADMIERLEEHDMASAFQELVELTEEMGLYDDLPPFEEEPVSQVHPVLEKPAEGDTGFLEDGAYILTFPRTGPLTDEAHSRYLRDVERAAEAAGYIRRSDGFRVATGFSDTWEYWVWVVS